MNRKPFGNYEVLGVLGKGGQSVVWMAESPEHGLVAVREIDEPYLNISKFKNAARELLFLKNTSHENIINILDYHVHAEMEYDGPIMKKIYIIMPLMDCSLQELFDKPKILPRKYHDFLTDEQHRNSNVRNIMTKLLLGVHYLHSNNIIHRDLSARNVMIRLEDNELKLKIIDLGLARDNIRGAMTDGIATAGFRSWEMLVDTVDYDHKVDIWSVGCIFAQLLSGEPLCNSRYDGHQSASNDIGVQMKNILSVAELPNNFNLESFLEEYDLYYCIPQLIGIQRTPTDERFADTILPKVAEHDDPERHSARSMKHLLKEMIQLLPNDRCSASQALQHPYLGHTVEQVQPLRDPSFVDKAVKIIEKGNSENPRTHFPEFVNIFNHICRQE
ncbi:hypothetical protein FO519_001834 [Halicephalobus sp. NKZ332]|nr:hypothetical protein FO519_001834 [Halicephalobus sp. NKZ332]